MAGFFWNHRMVAVETHVFDGETEITLQFCEVHYDDETKKPLGYSDACMVGNSPDEMAEIAKRLAYAATLPVMQLSDFPADPVEPLAVEDVISINPIPDNFKTPEAAAEVAAMLDAIAKGAR